MAENEPQHGNIQTDPYGQPIEAAPEQSEEVLTPPKKRTERSWLKGGFGAGNANRWSIVFVIAGVAIVLIFMLISMMPKKRQVAKNGNASQQQQQPQQQPKQPADVGLPTDRVPSPQPWLNADQDEFTPDKLQRSAQLAPKQPNNQARNAEQPRPNQAEGASANRNLGQVQPFTPPPVPGSGNGQWTPPAYGENAMSQVAGTSAKEVESSRRTALTRESLTFVDEATDTHASTSNVPASESEENSNLGYRPGYHLSTHLETVASTFLSGAPVIAVVDFDYQRNGVTIVPAGSRVVGTMGGANATGLVRINFTSIRLPSGKTVPINAIGLDHQLMPLKGYVTGRHRLEQFLLAGLAGTGNIAAVWSSSSGSLSEADLLKMQEANSFGSAINEQISDIQSEVQRSLVVTLPAGTEVEVLFTGQNDHPAAVKAAQTSATR